MLYLYLEDWSEYLSFIDEDIDHGEKIIKVYTSPNDPRIELDTPSLRVFEINDTSLKDEKFKYKGRETYTGREIEERLVGLSNYSKRAVRALFRFANRGDLGLSQTDMGIRRDGNWLVKHPLEGIDGIDLARQNPENRSGMIHLDVFDEESLVRLSKVIDLNEDTKQLVNKREGRRLKLDLQAELHPTSDSERK